MTNQEFETVVEKRIEKIRELLVFKGGVYARGNDRLSHFKRAGAILNTTPEKALLGIMVKHLVLMMDTLEDMEQGKRHSQAAIEEWLGDIDCYMVLLEGLLQESYAKDA